jgi:hypothetical protein
LCLGSPAERVLPDRGESSPIPRDIRSLLEASHAVEIINPVSCEVQDLILDEKAASPVDLEKDPRFKSGLVNMIRKSEGISKTAVPEARMVVKCNDCIAAKLEWATKDSTESNTLQYFQKHKSEIPAPKLLGRILLGQVFITFLSFLPGSTLEAKWPDLSIKQKSSVREHLDSIFKSLRTLPFPDGACLGDVGGEGCKDRRRHLRRNAQPIYSVKQFEDFQFSNPNYGGSIFIDFLRSFTREDNSQIVFTHGDLRPENILVEVVDDKTCKVTGIVDWETSGFYPEYHEATKSPIVWERTKSGTGTNSLHHPSHLACTLYTGYRTMPGAAS